MKFQCDCGQVVLETDDGDDEVIPCLCVACQKERREHERVLQKMPCHLYPAVIHDGG